MLPLRDNIKSSRVPYVTYGILGINVAAFLFEWSLGSDLQGFIGKYGVVPTAYTEGQVSFADRLIPIFTSMFLHGGWAHLLGNMLYLWIFADNVEDRLGHVRFGIFYLLCGIAATVAHILVNSSSSLPCVGASGAIGGVLGAYVITYPKARVLTLIFLGYFVFFREIPALVVLGFWFVMQLFSGVGKLTSAQYASGGTAYWAHIGGFVAGVALMLLLARKRKDPGPQEYIRSEWIRR